MSVKQIPILGLLLAVLFSPRASELATAPAHRAASSGAVHAPTESKKPAVTAKPDARTTDKCGPNLAGDLERLWWLTKDPNSCSVNLSPAWKEICKLNPAHPAGNAVLAPALGEAEFRQLCLGTAGPVGSMMAAIPNPRHTHLGLMTDRAIEAIQVAASEAHFIPLSHYLPWPAPGAASERSEPGQAAQDEDSPEPGVLIFHDGDPQTDNRPKYLLVFLIPEMPTEGLDREVFLRAAKMIDVASPGTTVIRFAGPNFSGSMPGLADLQNELLARHGSNNPSGKPQSGPCVQGIHAVSGSVTNSPDEFKGNTCLSFTPMETSDEEALCLFVRGTRAFGYQPSQIAILSEEGTQYGRQSPGEKKTEGDEEKTGDAPKSAAEAKTGSPSDVCYSADQNKDSNSAAATSATSRIDNDHADKDSNKQLWFLHFPREISKLRNAYGAEEVKASSGNSGASSGLGMQWQDTEGPQRDDIQTYGDRQTPLSQEAVLSTLSITLKAKGIKALGILATDPMDEAFLIYSIKKSSPDVRLFVRDPDLLFLRTPNVGSLNGTLLVSNFPLVPGNQFWSSTREAKHEEDAERNKNQKDGNKDQDQNSENDVERHLITFPSAYQEGEYNAFVELLEDVHPNWAPTNDHKDPPPMKRLEWDWPAGMNVDAEHYDGSRKNRPLWLAVIGTAGHYPVKVLNWGKQKPDELRLHSLDMGTPQLMPILLWSAIVLLGILHLLGLKYRKAVPSVFKHDFDFSDEKSTVTLVRLFCHMMAIATVALAQFILGSSYLFFWGSRLGYGPLAGSVILVSIVLLGGVGVLLREIHSLYPLQKTSGPDLPVANEIMSPKRMWRASLIGLAIMLVAGVAWGWMTLGNRYDNAFLHFRNLSLSSGVAPTLPLVSLLLVLYFGIWAYLRRLDYWQHRYVEMFNLDLDPVIRENLSDDVRGIDSCLLDGLENGRWTKAFLIVLFGSVIAFRPLNNLEMIEPANVAKFALCFFVLALFSIWLNWFRFLNIWVRLRKILDHLENLPLRTAFQRLPREKALPILQWSSAQSSFLLRQVLDRLRALAKADPSSINRNLLADFEARIDALMPQRQSGMTIVATNVVGGTPLPGKAPSVSGDPLRDARKEMTNLIVTLSSRLRSEFWNRGSSDGADQRRPKAADLKYLLAEDVVALPFYAYIHKVMQEMRNILFFLGIAISLLFAALHTYAFRTDQAIDWWFFGVFIAMGLGVIMVIAQVERHALVSRLTDKTAGELGGSFYLQLLKYGTVPILTIFGSQIPFISNVVLKWVQPALEALH